MPARVLIDGERTWRWVPFLSEEIATGGRSRWRLGLRNDAPERATGWLQISDDMPRFVVFSQVIGRYPQNQAAILYFVELTEPQDRRPPTLDPSSGLMEVLPPPEGAT